MWHASMYFEGERHVAACGTILETPVAGVRDDPRFVDGADACEACVASLDRESDEQRLPDGGEFERASELRADGGRRLDPAIDVGAVRERVDCWVRFPSQRAQAIHVPTDADREAPATPCRHKPRIGAPKAYDLGHFTDADLEARLCEECAFEALGIRREVDTSKFGRSPADVLAAAGLDEPDDRDHELVTDGGRNTATSESYRSLSPGNQAQGSDDRHSNSHNSGECHFPICWFDFGPGPLAPDRVKLLLEPRELIRPDRTRGPENKKEDCQWRFHISPCQCQVITLLGRLFRPAVASDPDSVPSIQCAKQRTLRDICTGAEQRGGRDAE